MTHVFQDNYFRNIYRQYTKPDILNQMPAKTIRDYRDPEWWKNIRSENPQKDEKQESNTEPPEGPPAIRNMKSSSVNSWEVRGEN